MWGPVRWNRGWKREKAEGGKRPKNGHREDGRARNAPEAGGVREVHRRALDGTRWGQRPTLGGSRRHRECPEPRRSV